MYISEYILWYMQWDYSQGFIFFSYLQGFSSKLTKLTLNWYFKEPIPIQLPQKEKIWEIILNQKHIYFSENELLPKEEAEPLDHFWKFQK